MGAKMLTVVLYFAIANALPTVHVQECPEFCNEIYQPVCGSDGRTYDNECFLIIASCLNPDIVVQAQGACAGVQCPEVCPFNYSPVCGSDGETYSNECSLNIASCQNPAEDISIIHDGECEPVNDCPAICPAIYAPVCGSDGNTYGNQCALDAANCEDTKTTIATVYDGECDPDTAHIAAARRVLSGWLHGPF